MIPSCAYLPNVVRVHCWYAYANRFTSGPQRELPLRLWAQVQIVLPREG
jgi:hypothetical protein